MGSVAGMRSQSLCKITVYYYKYTPLLMKAPVFFLTEGFKAKATQPTVYAKPSFPVAEAVSLPAMPWAESLTSDYRLESLQPQRLQVHKPYLLSHKTPNSKYKPNPVQTLDP